TPNSGKTNREDRFTTALNSLVTAGTITQDQENAILSTLKNTKPAMSSNGRRGSMGKNHK
ncbi:MAG: hypothetical protein GX434_13915, partial [Peptococcaceae bacterium]|nr:hypothetical protein [Peptococcaceae bacterium]